MQQMLCQAAHRLVYHWRVVNAPPIAIDQRINATNNTAIGITLSATDDDALGYHIVAHPGHGVLLGIGPI